MTAMSEDNSPTPPAANAPNPPSPAAAGDAQQAAALLKRLFPALFSGAPKPIMLKVQTAIEARAPGQFTKKALSTFLARHTGSTSYLLALTRAEQRFDLDGQPAGLLSAEHREAAKKLLAERRERVRAREQEMETARRWRLDLLHDHESTRLSRANFCALKNVPEAQLDALLAQAREERQAQPPRQDIAARRGPAARPGQAAPGKPRESRERRDQRAPRGPRPPGKPDDSAR